MAKQATSNTARFLGATLVAFGSILMIAVASVWTALAPSNVPVSFNGAEFAWLSLKQGLSAVMPAMMVIITAFVLLGSVIFSAVALKGICLRAKLKGFVLSTGPFVVLNASVWTWADASGMELVQAGMLLVPASVMVGITWGLWAPEVYMLTSMSASQYTLALRRMATSLDDRQTRIAEKRDAKKTAKGIKKEQAKANDGLFFFPGQEPAGSEAVNQPLHVDFKQEEPVDEVEPEPVPEASQDQPTEEFDFSSSTDDEEAKASHDLGWLNELPKPVAGDPVVEVVEDEVGRIFVAGRS
jgi:hypothetical protein